MSHKISRVEFLQRLEGTVPGLSPREVIQQSSCFIFRNGLLSTYNQLVFCRSKSGLPKKFEGAVSSLKLLSMLKKLPDEEIEVDFTETDLVVYGSRKETTFSLESEISLPIDDIEKPDKENWRELPSLFTEAVSVVQECASKDVSEETLVCVHIHPKWIEASDNFQGTRFRLRTGVEEPFLVKRESLKHIVSFGMSQINETKNWVHFRNPVLRISCPRFMDKYPNCKHLYKATGNPVEFKLPKKLDQAADRAMEFSKENSEDDQVTIILQRKKVTVIGEGVSGGHKEFPKIKYLGPDMAFRISPKLLIEICKRHTQCLIMDGKLLVDGGKWKYAVSLSKPEDIDKETKKRQRAKEEVESGDMG